jgi:anti-sigma factor RsiW
MMGPLRMMRFLRDHRWTRRHLSEYVDGELDAHGRERVEHHVHLCPKCRRMLATFKRTLAGLMGLREDGTGEIAEAVIARLRADS